MQLHWLSFSCLRTCCSIVSLPFPHQNASIKQSFQIGTQLVMVCCVQALRSVGSGCATQSDVDWVWQEVQSQVIRDMAFEDNVRTDGRGLIDSRPASFQVQAMPCPALPCPALPCPALPCPALPCSVLLCPALPCPHGLCFQGCLFPVQPCPAASCCRIAQSSAGFAGVVDPKQMTVLSGSHSKLLNTFCQTFLWQSKVVT